MGSAVVVSLSSGFFLLDIAIIIICCVVPCCWCYKCCRMPRKKRRREHRLCCLSPSAEVQDTTIYIYNVQPNTLPAAYRESIGASYPPPPYQPCAPPLPRDEVVRHLYDSSYATQL